MENGKILADGKRNSLDSEDCCSLHSSSHSDGPLCSIKDGLWQEQEVFRFISYLLFNRQALKLKLQRRTSKIFKQMAVFIRSRTSVQCRSQNQRLFQKYKSLKNIVSCFKEEYGCQRFEEDYAKIIEDPGIKFKTEYQTYVERHIHKVCQVATQTDQGPFFSYENLYPLAYLTSGFEYLMPMTSAFENWIIVPFCS